MFEGVGVGSDYGKEVRKRRKGLPLWIECPHRKLILGLLDLKIPWCRTCRTQGNLCVIAILGIKRSHLRDDRMSLTIVPNSSDQIW